MTVSGINPGLLFLAFAFVLISDRVVAGLASLYRTGLQARADRLRNKPDPPPSWEDE